MKILQSCGLVCESTFPFSAVLLVFVWHVQKWGVLKVLRTSYNFHPGSPPQWVFSKYTPSIKCVKSIKDFFLKKFWNFFRSQYTIKKYIVFDINFSSSGWFVKEECGLGNLTHIQLPLIAQQFGIFPEWRKCEPGEITNPFSWHAPECGWHSLENLYPSLFDTQALFHKIHPPKIFSLAHSNATDLYYTHVDRKFSVVPLRLQKINICQNHDDI